MLSIIKTCCTSGGSVAERWDVSIDHATVSKLLTEITFLVPWLLMVGGIGLGAAVRLFRWLSGM